MRPSREGSSDHAFLENYEGGWQALFPSAGDPCSYRGEPIPFHGEVATPAWDGLDAEASGDGVTVRMAVRCRRTPFTLERTLLLPSGSDALEVTETATNESSSEAHLVWGQLLQLVTQFIFGQSAYTVDIEGR